MDVAVIVSTLAGLALAVAKSLMEEQQRWRRQASTPHPPPPGLSEVNREHI